MEKFLSFTHRNRSLWQARIGQGPSSHPALCKLDSPQLFICTLPLSDDKQQRPCSAICVYSQLLRWSPTVLFRVTPPSLVDASKNTSFFTHLSVLIPPISSLVNVIFYCRMTVRRYGSTDPVNCDMCTADRPCTLPLSTASPFTCHRRHLTPPKTRCLLEPVHFCLGGQSVFFRSGSGVFVQS